MFENIKNFFTKTNSVSGLFQSVNRQGSVFNKGRILSMYEQSLYLNRAITKRAEKVGEINFVIKDTNGKVIEKGDAIKWLELLQKPNKYQTGDQFWRTVQKYYDLYGFVVLVPNQDESIFTKMVTSLSILPSQDVAIHTNADQTEILHFNHKTHEYNFDDVIYIHNPSIRNPILGESLIISAYNAVNTEIQIGQYQSRVIENGGKLETIFKFKNSLNGEQIAKLKEQYRDSYAEAKNAGEPIFLGGDAELMQTALSPKELDFMGTQDKMLDNIVIATGVPKSILGVTSGETFANADASIRIFLRETIKPILENITDILNWRLIPDNYDLCFVDPTPEDKDEKRKDVETADKVNALTTNEKREMLGFDPIKNGDEILIPFNLTELGKSREIKAVKKKTIEHPLQNKEYRDMYRKAVDGKMTSFENKMTPIVRDFFKDQKERVLLSMGETKKRKNLFGEVFNSTLEINLAKQALLPIIREIFVQNGQDTMDTFQLGEFQLTSHMESVIQARADMLTDSIINTTGEQLAKQFKESFEQGESRQELVERINNLYADIDIGRAEVIARTEVHNAMQSANYEAYKQAGLEMKIWVTVGDERVRDEHAMMDGEERPINAPFSNGLMYPNEPNCRCSI